jgi:hypothetical protein
MFLKMASGMESKPMSVKDLKAELEKRGAYPKVSVLQLTVLQLQRITKI